MFFASVKKAKNLLEKGEIHKAFAMFKKMAEKGDAEAQYNLARMYDSISKGVSKSFGDHAEEVEFWLEKAAAQGHKDARAYLALFKKNKNSWLLKAVDAKMKKEAAEEEERKRREAAAQAEREEREIHAKVERAIELEETKEYATALALLRQAAESKKPLRDVTIAMFKIGLYYWEGLAVPYDYKQARNWILAAGKRGYEDAAGALEDMQSSEGMRLALLGREGAQAHDARDYKTAREKFAQVASILNAEDRHELYDESTIRAAVNAAMLLGNMHGTGKGGPTNYGAARSCYTRALREGEAEAAEKLEILAELERLDRARGRR